MQVTAPKLRQLELGKDGRFDIAERYAPGSAIHSIHALALNVFQTSPNACNVSNKEHIFCMYVAVLYNLCVAVRIG